MKTTKSPSSRTSPMDRREFMLGVGALLAAAEAGRAAPGSASPGTGEKNARIGRGERKETVIGIQMGPHTMLDEGIDRVLDLVQETAAVNTLMVYSHTYHSNLKKPLSWLAPDHGMTPKDLLKRNFPSVWVKHNQKYFKGTILRHHAVDASYEYADRDLFTELAKPARQRGMKLYARILEGSGRFVSGRIANFSKVATIDVYGRPTMVACWNNPDYKNWWMSTVEDMFRSYDLDGLQWGAERMGPLMNVIMPWNDGAPTCFCEYCQARGRSQGIDVERARQGFERLYVYVRGLMADKPKPADGVFTGFLRILLRFPEILAWEYQYRMSRENVMQAIYGTVKSINPSAQVGWHVDHQPSSWDLVYRAELSYEEMAPYSDFIKFIAYHDVLGPRIRWWYLERLKKTVLRELSLDQSLDLYYDLFGYDKNLEPKVADLEKIGFSPDYVFRETKRSVASAAGKTRIYPGIGFDVPWNSDHIPADPEKVYQAVIKAFEAGADGIVVSREYEEMRVPNLKAVGRAVGRIVKKPN